MWWQNERLLIFSNQKRTLTAEDKQSLLTTGSQARSRWGCQSHKNSLSAVSLVTACRVRTCTALKAQAQTELHWHRPRTYLVLCWTFLPDSDSAGTSPHPRLQPPQDTGWGSHTLFILQIEKRLNNLFSNNPEITALDSWMNQSSLSSERLFFLKICLSSFPAITRELYLSHLKQRLLANKGIIRESHVSLALFLKDKEKLVLAILWIKKKSP